MAAALFAIHGDLQDFVDRGSVSRTFEGAPAIKDTIEAIGIPRPEVAAIIVGGNPVGFDYRIRDGDVVDVFPATDPSLPAAIPRLGPPLPDPPRFILDAHLGRLARYLRLLGFDTAYANDAVDEDLARTAAAEQRILLTRDRGLLKRRIVGLGRLVRHDDPRRQLEEVVRRYGLAPLARPFERCVRCNGRIEPVDRTVIEHLLEPKTRRYYDTFGRCEVCGSVYWKGSHFERMDRLVEDVLTATDRPDGARGPTARDRLDVEDVPAASRPDGDDASTSSCD